MGASCLTRRRGMGIYRPNPKTSHCDLYRYGTTAPTRGTAVKIRGTITTLKNSIGHLTENAITFYSELRFQ
jgi:hypothetical protein